MPDQKPITVGGTHDVVTIGVPDSATFVEGGLEVSTISGHDRFTKVVIKGPSSQQPLEQSFVLESNGAFVWVIDSDDWSVRVE